MVHQCDKRVQPKMRNLRHNALSSSQVGRRHGISVKSRFVVAKPMRISFERCLRKNQTHIPSRCIFFTKIPGLFVWLSMFGNGKNDDNTYRPKGRLGCLLHLQMNWWAQCSYSSRYEERIIPSMSMTFKFGSAYANLPATTQPKTPSLNKGLRSLMYNLPAGPPPATITSTSSGWPMFVSTAIYDS